MHTPGPWEVNADNPTIVDDAYGPLVETGFDDFSRYEEAKANAHLIAAAPDLLEIAARQGVHNDIVAVVTEHLDEFPAKWRDFLERLAERAAENAEAARVAIAKAKGESCP